VEVVLAARRLKKMIKWFLGAAACCALGAWLLFDSNLHDDPRRLSPGDVVRGSCPILAGLIMFALPWLVVRRPKQIPPAPLGAPDAGCGNG
jgi:peptidoglycan/LPS O-acetylase OafA/YrhL